MNSNPLGHKVAIVTGASSGIGRATAIALATAGATVIVNHFPSKDACTKAEAVVREIGDAGGCAILIAADISSEDQVQAMFAETLSRFSQLDILVNNAGIERPSPIQDMTIADWQAVIDVNLTGQFGGARIPEPQNSRSAFSRHRHDHFREFGPRDYSLGFPDELCGLERRRLSPYAIARSRAGAHEDTGEFGGTRCDPNADQP